jgi:hypothetical protein
LEFDGGRLVRVDATEADWGWRERAPKGDLLDKFFGL